MWCSDAVEEDAIGGAVAERQRFAVAAHARQPAPVERADRARQVEPDQRAARRARVLAQVLQEVSLAAADLEQHPARRAVELASIRRSHCR